MSSISSEQTKESVLVIGAGVAGLTAAKSLVESHFVNVTVMEAADVVGGRVQSVKFGSTDLVVERGAHWLHSLEKNPLVKELVALDLVDEKITEDREKLAEPENDYFNAYYFFDNEFPHAEQWIFHEAVEQSLVVCHKALATPDKVGISQEMLRRDALGECLDTAMQRWLDQRAGDNARKRLFFERSKETALNFHRFSEGTDRLEQVSYRASNEYDDEGGDWRPPLQTGLSSMIQGWANAIGQERILLNHAVTKLTYTGNQVEVQFQPRDASSAPQTRCFDHVVVTCPLDFLKKHHETLFEPKLPTKKVKALSKLSLGYIEKVFIELNEPVYPEHLTPESMGGFSVHTTADEAVNPLFHGEHSFYSLHESGKYYFTVFLREDAEKMIALPKEELQQQLQQFLAKSVNKPNLQIVNLERTDWATNPFILGGYSHVHPKTSMTVFDDISRPLFANDGKPLILFAGEHTHEFWFSGMHGAFVSGKRAAKRLIKYHDD